MGKLDVKHAFRICPIHQSDWGLLGFFVEGKYFMDIRLPFGGRSSPFIFNSVADALHWILVHMSGIPCLLHYLDNFFNATADRVQCQADMQKIVKCFNLWGFHWPRTRQLGQANQEINSVKWQVRLPDDKLEDLNTVVGR
jgi:hypothetical protein